jgi:hypothetical protein
MRTIGTTGQAGEALGQLSAPSGLVTILFPLQSLAKSAFKCFLCSAAQCCPPHSGPSNAVHPTFVQRCPLHYGPIWSTSLWSNAVHLTLLQ